MFKPAENTGLPILMESFPFVLDSFDPSVDTISSEVIDLARNSVDRSIARRACLQILYELDLAEHQPAAVLQAHFAARPESYAVRQIVRRIVMGVWAARHGLDAILQTYAPEWPIEQVAAIDRNILRIALYELQLQKRNTPVPVIVNEAVHLAQLFGAENSHSFVHGVLGAITADATSAPPLKVDEATPV